MSKAIWKETLSLEFHQTYHWPAGAQVLHGEVQNGEPRLWFLCDPDEPRRPRHFALLPTGGPFAGAPELLEKVIPELFVATFLLHGGELVAHLFEVGFSEDTVTGTLAKAGKTPLKEAA